VGILMLAFVSDGTMAFITEILTSFALPLETIMLPLITTELFGRKSYAFLMGLIVSFNTLGYAVGTPLMNLFYDLTGTYTNVMVFMCGVMVIVAVVMQFVISAAHRERERVEQEEKNRV
jgi:predicted MFS family arabinose efflux permease